MRELTDDEYERYARHIILEGVGAEGQAKLLNSSVLIIGAGGLGSPVGLYLAAAGVGRIGIVDHDVVEPSNLQRQVIHTEARTGIPKALSAAESMIALNPHIIIEPHVMAVNAGNLLKLVEDYDFVIDGTDNFAAKFLINDACVLANKPYSHGGILRFTGQSMTVLPHKSACYACVFDSPPPAESVPTCATAGILGAVAGMLGTIQAAEALKYLIGVGEVLADQMLHFDAKTMDFRKVRFKKNPNCRVCGEHGIKKLSDYEGTVCDV